MDTNSDTRDYGRRVDAYIRTLHRLIVDARKTLDGADSFPWSEWAAFFAQWDQYFFEEIEHGIILWFAEDTIREYQQQAVQWEKVIAKHYHRAPEGPRPPKHGDTGMVGYGLLAIAAVIAVAAWRSPK